MGDRLARIHTYQMLRNGGVGPYGKSHMCQILKCFCVRAQAPFSAHSPVPIPTINLRCVTKVEKYESCQATATLPQWELGTDTLASIPASGGEREHGHAEF